MKNTREEQMSTRVVEPESRWSWRKEMENFVRVLRFSFCSFFLPRSVVFVMFCLVRKVSHVRQDPSREQIQRKMSYRSL
jgi:hypothetical protein